MKKLFFSLFFGFFVLLLSPQAKAALIIDTGLPTNVGSTHTLLSSILWHSVEIELPTQHRIDRVESYFICCGGLGGIVKP